MARLYLAGMPAPPDYADWCAVCCALAKGRVFGDDGVSRRAQEGLADPGRDVVTVVPPARLNVAADLQEAVTWAPSPVVGGGIPVPVCWSHLPAVDGTAPPPEQPPPPSLLRPRGHG